ncbi:MAG: prohibitin family protein, partial [Rhodocyclaceae bacterium]|nr:prohibitin family protein [Rhodocyclaceae bacterium]
MADPAMIWARLTAGFRRLSEESREALTQRLLARRGVLFLHVAAFLVFGPLGLLATAGVHALVEAWRAGEGAVPTAPRSPLGDGGGSAAASNPFASPFRRSAAGSPSVFSGVPAMPRFIKVLLSFAAAVLVLWILSPFAIVPAGHRGVVTTFGKVSPEVFDEGIHLVIPVAQAVYLMDVRIQKGEGAGDAASKDLQQVHTTVALNYHIDPKEAANVFQDVGTTIGDKIIVPAVQEAVKAATAQYTAEELITKRPEVRDRIRGLLVERLTRHGVAVDEFSIVNFTFSKSFNEAIEGKTTAEQLKLKAE